MMDIKALPYASSETRFNVLKHRSTNGLSDMTVALVKSEYWMKGYKTETVIYHSVTYSLALYDEFRDGKYWFVGINDHGIYTVGENGTLFDRDDEDDIRMDGIFDDMPELLEEYFKTEGTYKYIQEWDESICEIADCLPSIEAEKEEDGKLIAYCSIDFQGRTLRYCGDE